MSWTGLKRKFIVEDKGITHTSWEDNEDGTEIYLEKKQKKMMDQIYEISLSEDNGNLPYCLVVAVPKKQALLIDLKRNRNECF